jgi:hypothetical protein
MHPAERVKSAGVFVVWGWGISTSRPISQAMLSLTVRESADAVLLEYGGVARGKGASLQEAADDLIQSILGVVMAFRSSGFAASTEIPPDFETLNFLAVLAEVAASGGDIRELVFG